MKDLVQVKLISGRDDAEVEYEVNKFLEGVPPEKFIDLKVWHGSGEQQVCHALVIYRAILL